MAHRKRKYAADYKQDKINNLSYAGIEGRRAIVEGCTREQWKKRFATNVTGFWKASNAKAHA